MKKFLIFLSVISLIICSAEAKDYVKMQVKEMKHAQKYSTTKNVLQNKTQPEKNIVANVKNIKDPKIMKFNNHDDINKNQYDEKIKKDDTKYEVYAKQLSKKHSKYYTTQADAEDFYKIYRVAEKLIRANNLDYMNWRICIKKDVNEVNAYSDGSNLITITTSMYDSFFNNDDAMAFIIGHEMGHILLGHSKRSAQLLKKMEREKQLAKTGNYVAGLAYQGMMRKYLIDSKNMEYAADVEGAKLALHAGYNLNNASDVIAFFSTTDIDRDFRKDHPSSDKRLENIKENSKFFPEEWKKTGEYNIYNSEVLPVQLSSDRKSIVISAPQNKLNPDRYYNPETMNELYARLGYMYYKNGQFEKSLEYFGELFKIDETNAPAYLYASYASEYLYKNTNNTKYLNLAKEYANKALSLDSKNNYMKEQVDNL